MKMNVRKHFFANAVQALAKECAALTAVESEEAEEMESKLKTISEISDEVSWAAIEAVTQLTEKVKKFVRFFDWKAGGYLRQRMVRERCKSISATLDRVLDSVREDQVRRAFKVKYVTGRDIGVFSTDNATLGVGDRVIVPIGSRGRQAYGVISEMVDINRIPDAPKIIGRFS